jgi:hypothetical protein
MIKPALCASISFGAVDIGSPARDDPLLTREALREAIRSRIRDRIIDRITSAPTQRTSGSTPAPMQNAGESAARTPGKAHHKAE